MRLLKPVILKLCVLGIISLFVANSAHADEGMWLLNAFPGKTVKEKYQFEPSQSWLDKVRLASARLAGGCSASFVSKNGLVMTNHHCAETCIEQLSKAGKDYIANGFYARSQTEEIKCPTMEVNRLVQITDVTARLRAATKGTTGKAFNDQLKATSTIIEKECAGSSSDVRCDVVTLYNGGLYHLYKYQRYQDVRLVFAPEMAIAFFGGDPDNFMFPRYNLDVSFVRVYDKDRPLETNDYFKWSKDGAKENELTFVTGHPGSTSRLHTVAQLEFTRDVELVQDLLYLSEARGMWTEFRNRGPEQKRRATGRLFGIENSIKAMRGQYQAILEKSLMEQKVQAERNLRKKVNSNPKWRKEYGKAWDEIKKALDEYKKIYVRYQSIERTRLGSDLFSIARKLVRASEELPKANEKRYREFVDSALPQLKQGLFSAAPIYEDVEIAGMTFALTKIRERLGADDALVKKIFGKKSAEDLAQELVKGSQLKDVAVREKLFNGGAAAIQASKDPMIRFAKFIDADAREVRRKFEDEIETKLKQNSEKVAQARFAVEGMKSYPDATFTLRISYGQIQGYEEKGELVKPFTTLGGVFNRHTGSEPFNLPESWLKNKSALNLQTPYNFASTNDIIGGNSGSPVINKEAEIVGLIFDGNIQSLGGEFAFDESVNRAVSVHSAAIMETLHKIYGAQRVIDDLTEGQTQTKTK